MKINLRELNVLQPAPLIDAVLVNLTELALERGWVIDKGQITYETVPYDLIVGHEQGMIPAVSWGNLLNGHHTSMGHYLGIIEDSPNFFSDQFGVLGIFRPKTTKCSGGPAVCGLQRGITFFEIPIWALFE